MKTCASLVVLIFFFFLFPFSVSVFSQGNDLDYSKFLHTSQKHASIACTACSLCSGLGDAMSTSRTLPSARAGSTKFPE